MLSHKRDSQADVIAAFNNTSRYLDDILNLDNPFLAHLAQSAKVSFWDQPLSVVRRRES